jgi:glycolate oxidase
MREKLNELKAALSDCPLIEDEDIIESYRYDRSNAFEAAVPLAVIRPRNENEVSTILSWANHYRVPVVTRGAGSGLAGGAIATEGCIVLSTELMQKIEIDPAASIATVGAGVLNAELKKRAKEHGLWYPPDPSSYEICSIGGNLATNAGGICCVKYGVTTDYALGLTVVLSDGKILKLGGKTVKNVTGYDLKRLFIGSEGTLGVITEADLRLLPAPPPVATVVAGFSSIVDAGNAIAEIAKTLRPSALELMDSQSLSAVEKNLKMGLDTSLAALLLGCFEITASKEPPELRFMTEICKDNKATEIYHTSDEQESTAFMNARRMAIPSVEKLGHVLIEDVGVPIPKIPELLKKIADISYKESITVATIGHAGDGNFHPLVVFDNKNPEEKARALKVFGGIMDAAISLGGTITGEHGVGTLKLAWVESQLGSDTIDILKKIKYLFDPNNILNPNKAF